MLTRGLRYELELLVWMLHILLDIVSLRAVCLVLILWGVSNDSLLHHATLSLDFDYSRLGQFRGICLSTQHDRLPLLLIFLNNVIIIVISIKRLL